MNKGNQWLRGVCPTAESLVGIPVIQVKPELRVSLSRSSNNLSPLLAALS